MISTAWASSSEIAANPLRRCQARQPVEAGEPLERREPREQQQLDEHEVGAEQPGDAADGPIRLAVSSTSCDAARAPPQADDDDRVGRHEERQPPAGDPGSAHDWKDATPVPLRLPDHWLWDFWFAVDGDDVHVFYLQAPRALGDPELRHHNATIGHAVSRDLRRWEVLPDALGARRPRRVRRPRHVDRQRRAPRRPLAPLLHRHRARRGRRGAADRPRHLRRPADLGARRAAARSRPALVRPRALARPVGRVGPGARALGHVHLRHVGGRGILAHAHSPDLRTWTTGPPLSPPTGHVQLEVPQLVRHNVGWWMLFSDVFAGSGIHYLSAPERLGPYAAESRDLLPRSRPRQHYAGRLLDHGGERLLFAWLMDDEDGAFVGELSDPMPLAGL